LPFDTVRRIDGWYRGRRDTAGLQRLTLLRLFYLLRLRLDMNNLETTSSIENTMNRTDG
jgi:hypothetical protein